MGCDGFPKLGLGTWMMGGRDMPDPSNDDAADIAAIRRAVEAGISHIDTAEYYADGKAEKLVGRAIGEFDRSALFIASKVRAEKLSYADVMSSCEASLERLGVDCLDLYYVHKPNPQIPMAETAEAFNYLLRKKMIKEIGLSNVSVKTIEKYNKYLEKPVFAVQNNYNLIVRQLVEAGVTEYCREHNIHFVAWRPLQLPIPALGIKSLTERGAYPLLDEMADKYGKSNAQIAVKWIIAQCNVSAIFKTSNPDHLRQIIDCERFEMSLDDLNRLTKEFPLQTSYGLTSAGRLDLL